MGWNGCFWREKSILEKSCQSYHRLQFPGFRLIGLANMKTVNGSLKGGRSPQRRRDAEWKMNRHVATDGSGWNVGGRRFCPGGSGREGSNPSGSARLKVSKTAFARLRPPSPTSIFSKRILEVLPDGHRGETRCAKLSRGLASQGRHDMGGQEELFAGAKRGRDVTHCCGWEPFY